MHSRSKQRNGIPPAANVYQVIHRLFNNVIAKNCETGTAVLASFAKLELTDAQKSRLTIPEGLVQTGLYLLFQFDNLAGDVVQSTDLQIVVFLTKNGSIYGSYSHIVGQPRFGLDEISESCGPLGLASTVTFVPRNYIEAYNLVGDIPTVQGLSSVEPATSTLQFTLKVGPGKIYYYQTLGADGVTNAADPPFRIIGLSCSLECVE
jgi:hypothetical protein